MVPARIGRPQKASEQPAGIGRPQKAGEQPAGIGQPQKASEQEVSAQPSNRMIGRASPAVSAASIGVRP